VNLSELPLETRVEAAIQLVHSGFDPSSALAAAVWPKDIFVVPGEPVRFCQRGHAMTDDNTYVRPGGTRQCRACISDRRHHWRRKNKDRVRRKVPCAYCGEPATRPSDKGTGGLPTPRCRKCFFEQSGLHGRSMKRRAA